LHYLVVDIERAIVEVEAAAADDTVIVRSLPQLDLLLFRLHLNVHQNVPLVGMVDPGVRIKNGQHKKRGPCSEVDVSIDLGNLLKRLCISWTGILLRPSKECIVGSVACTLGKVPNANNYRDVPLCKPVEQLNQLE
jgi:hypothetical protein